MHSISQIIPPSDGSFAAGWMTKFERIRLETVLSTIARSYLPIPNFFKYQFWNTTIFIIGDKKAIGVLFSLGLLTFALILFARKPVGFFLYTTGTFGILFFLYFKVVGWLRHWGHLYVIFIICLWISSSYDFCMSSLAHVF